MPRFSSIGETITHTGQKIVLNPDRVAADERAVLERKDFTHAQAIKDLHEQDPNADYRRAVAWPRHRPRRPRALPPPTARPERSTAATSTIRASRNAEEPRTWLSERSYAIHSLPDPKESFSIIFGELGQTWRSFGRVRGAAVDSYWTDHSARRRLR